jgi:hypothetical protein
MGPCPRNGFRTSHWPVGSCEDADGLGPDLAYAWPEIPIRIPNQNTQILTRLTASDKVGDKDSNLKL